MSPTLVGTVVFAAALGGTLVGNWLRTTLPEHHLDDDSRDTVKLGIGLIATMTALVLGLVTASAKTSFDGMSAAVKESAMDALALDRTLARYGPETREIRTALQQSIGGRIDLIWPQSSSRPIDLDPSLAQSSVEGIAGAIHALDPHSDSQKVLHARALDLVEKLLRARWLVVAGGGTSVPLPFLVVLTFWLTITFASFGLFSPQNATVFAVLFVCALSVGSAVFLILEMDGPFDGLLKISPDPMRSTHAQLNR